MKDKTRNESDFLFPTPTFLTGAGTVLNLAGNYYDFNGSKTDFEADCKAIRNDFAMIGQDMEDAMLKISSK